MARVVLVPDLVDGERGLADEVLHPGEVHGGAAPEHQPGERRAGHREAGDGDGAQGYQLCPGRQPDRGHEGGGEQADGHEHREEREGEGLDAEEDDGDQDIERDHL